MIIRFGPLRGSARSPDANHDRPPAGCPRLRLRSARKRRVLLATARRCAGRCASKQMGGPRPRRYEIRMLVEETRPEHNLEVPGIVGGEAHVRDSHLEEVVAVRCEGFREAIETLDCEGGVQTLPITEVVGEGSVGGPDTSCQPARGDGMPCSAMSSAAASSVARRGSPWWSTPEFSVQRSIRLRRASAQRT